MMKQTLALIVSGIISTGLFSCRHSRQIARTSFPVADTSHQANTADSASIAAANTFNTEMLAKLRSNYISFNTFSAKLKVDFETEAKQMSGISVNLRMQKDSIIWISASAPIIGEVARAVITPDSLKAIDKFHKIAYLRGMKDAKDILHIPFDFRTLQDLIIGNPVYLTDSVYQVVKTPAVVSFACDSTVFTSLFNVLADDYILQQSKVIDKDSTRNRSVELTYGEYKSMDKGKFATRRQVYVEDKKYTKINMEFNKIDFDQPISLPFSIPSSYSRE
ncbi:DUF4292 domain-containing protein [Chitinophaga rhizophila]|uniref:DUF4292 domain-containing protein n=1 Tax=Chitinophaga rhizophila TaxID=2866212 RepID=A0ABS7GH12_9BACT|nr:DUF4292 domain-containing protein [Chitinophaga rhizophila]MBW8686535.1 DUF4292 domain-containing protein [Chitinophaga rhizophila]